MIWKARILILALVLGGCCWMPRTNSSAVRWYTPDEVTRNAVVSLRTSGTVFYVRGHFIFNSAGSCFIAPIAGSFGDYLELPTVDPSYAPFKSEKVEAKLMFAESEGATTLRLLSMRELNPKEPWDQSEREDREDPNK